nr:MAG TPA: hypothetical protein [Bacteriophage sp.]
MLPSEELLQSIDIIAQNAAKNGVKIYTAIVTAIADNNTCSVRANGKTHSGITYYGETPTVNKSYRIFCPNGSMNQAFIITGGGSLPIASADTLGGIKVGAGLTISSEGTLSATGGGTADAVEWSNVLDKPSTIFGYGITDARISGNTITLGAQTMTPYTANNTPPYPVTSVNGQTGVVVIDIPEPYELPIASTTQLGGVKVGAGLSVTENGVLSATGGGTADAVEWNNVLDKPTTIAGYGITDAKIDNGTITLGDKTITPLTSAPVTSVNSKTGDVELTADDVGALSKPATMTANKWFKTDANGAVALSDLPNASTGSKGITYLVNAYNRTDTDKAVTPKALNDVYKLIPEVTETLGTSTTKVPSEKAVSDALSSFGTGDMLKSTYDPTGTVATAGGIPNYVEANGGKIDTIKVNGTAQTITNKTVDISVPTKTSDLTNDSGYLTSAPVTSVNSKTGTVELTKTDIDLGNVDNVKQYSASNPPPYPVKSVNNMTGDVETTFIFELNITDSGTEGEPLCQSSIDVSTIIQAYQENKQVIGQSVYTSYLGQFELLSCPSYAGDGNEMVFIGALSNIEIGLEGQVYTIKYTPTMDGDYVHANATPFKVDIPDNLVKYQSLSTVQATTKVNADTLQGHAADYFATTTALATTNSNVSTNTSDISTLQSGLSTANANISNKLDKSGGIMTGALVAQSNTNYTTRQVRNIIISTADPSGGQSGDIWLKYSP